MSQRQKCRHSVQKKKCNTVSATVNFKPSWSILSTFYFRDEAFHRFYHSVTPSEDLSRNIFAMQSISNSITSSFSDSESEISKEIYCKYKVIIIGGIP